MGINPFFLNFAMHSVRMEACDCPPTHRPSSEEQSKSSVSPEQVEPGDASFGAAECPVQDQGSSFFGWSDEIAEEKGVNPEYARVKKDPLFLGGKSSKKQKGRAADRKGSQIKEKSRSSVKESEKQRRASSEEFSKVLFWQFHNFRMLLGSDLLLFSNEKYASVSLHLWDVSRQITPLTWLEAWLDNVMASVQELAVCYHQDGVVQGYELLKTDDIFLLKGNSEDGTPAFHPHVVQQNGLSVLKFLQENCKQDPGAYWLYKSAGEDVIQLFDLSVIPKKPPPNDCDGCPSVLPSFIHRGRSDSILSLGTLLYRVAHRLSLSLSPINRARCARFFKRCIDFLDEPDHLVVRACAHEQFARFLLSYEEEFDMVSESLPLESGVVVADTEEESFDFFGNTSGSIVRSIVYSQVADDDSNKDNESCEDLGVGSSTRVISNENGPAPVKLTESGETEMENIEAEPSSVDGSFSVCKVPKSTTDVVQTVADPIPSKLAAIHHVSQAIKSLRWKRQLQGIEEMANERKTRNISTPPKDFSVCACGDIDCIEVCDIKEWLPNVKLDDQLWKLVLLLGESYLALGQIYKDNGELHKALKIVELASLVYGSMPQHIEETRFISSMVSSLPHETDHFHDCLVSEKFSTYLFWAKAWTLVGDVHVEFHLIKGNEVASKANKKPNSRELKMSSEVLKEVKRLKKKLGQLKPNCSLCSLVNCSCQSDRASSGNSASSSGSFSRPFIHGLKQSKRSNKKSSNSLPRQSEDDHPSPKVEDESGKSEFLKQHEKICDVQLGTAGEKAAVKAGGIFKYLVDPLIGDTEYYLSAAICCYEEAKKALGGQPCSTTEMQSVLKKKGWVCNELGRRRLERKEMDEAELAFADAIDSFREVSDHTNIILIYCNLGHGRRALAEEMVSKTDTLRKHNVFHSAYVQAIESAKLEYAESLRYYAAAKMELNACVEEVKSISSSLRNEVLTQFAHTHLRLGMLLAKEDTTAEIYEKGALETFTSPGINKKEQRKHEVSANEAIREALSIYESLGELRKQEAAYAYFQLACYQRDCCLKFLELDQKRGTLSRSGSNSHQRVKQYASLAERNWGKSLDFYGPETHPIMYLTLLMERAILLLRLSSYLHSYAMLETALSHLLKGCFVSDKAIPETLRNDFAEMYAKFWSQLQTLLKKMLAMALSASSNSRSSSSSSNNNNNNNSQQSLSGDVVKLRELYKMSLKSTELHQLSEMHRFWTS